MFGKVCFDEKVYWPILLKILLKYTKWLLPIYLPSFNVVGFVNNLANLSVYHPKYTFLYKIAVYTFRN